MVRVIYLSPNYGITTTLWEVTVEAINQITNVSHRKTHHVHLRLFNTLEALREFYHYDGAGVDRKALDTLCMLSVIHVEFIDSQYCLSLSPCTHGIQSLVSKLGILAMTTNQLIFRFYYDLLNCQQDETREERKFELVVSVAYIKETSVVEVNVVHGENMGKYYS